MTFKMNWKGPTTKAKTIHQSTSAGAKFLIWNWCIWIVESTLGGHHAARCAWRHAMPHIHGMVWAISRALGIHVEGFIQCYRLVAWQGGSAWQFIFNLPCTCQGGARHGVAHWGECCQPGQSRIWLHVASGLKESDNSTYSNTGTMCSFFTEELPHLLAVLLPRIDPAGSHWKQLPARQKQWNIQRACNLWCRFLSSLDAFEISSVHPSKSNDVPTSARGRAIHHPPALALVLSTKENAWILPFSPSLEVASLAISNILRELPQMIVETVKQNVNIPSEKYIYVHKYVYICVYTYLCKMDEYRSYAGLS